MRPLIRSLLSSYERLIHHIFVFQERKVGRRRSIADLEFGILLALSLTDLLDVGLVLVVDLARLSVLPLVLLPIRAHLFVSLALLKGLEYMVHIVSAVSAGGQPDLGLLHDPVSSFLIKGVHCLELHWTIASRFILNCVFSRVSLQLCRVHRTSTQTSVDIINLRLLVNQQALRASVDV
jgi:hypothetical protein